MIQSLPYDEIEMWHGHPDLYMNELEEIFKTLDDCDFGYFVEFDLRYLDDVKERKKISHLLLKIKLFLRIHIINI